MRMANQNGSAKKVPNSCPCSLMFSMIGCVECPLKAIKTTLFMQLHIFDEMMMLPLAALRRTNWLRIWGGMKHATPVMIGTVHLKSSVQMALVVIM